MRFALIITLSCAFGLFLFWMISRRMHAKRRRRRQVEMILRLEAAFEAYYPWVLRVPRWPGLSQSRSRANLAKNSLNKAQLAAIYERAPR
jgi:hypothetical protein